ncbi:hypothetical protein LUZ60_002672 [Juncus effusus]|nr:hypothetical protein LUZ60_002672 [Juncus effusus]
MRGSTVINHAYCWSDDAFYLPILMGDLKTEGIFMSDGETRSACLGNACCGRLPFFEKNGISYVPLDEELTVPDESVDFVLATEGLEAGSFLFLDRVVKIGGIVVTRLCSDGSSPFHLPGNYNIVYVRQFGLSTIVAIKKIAQSGFQIRIHGNGQRRRLLGIEFEKKDVLGQLEGVLLEPLTEKDRILKINFLPILTRDPLTQYLRRVFIDVGSEHTRASSEKWFEENYPKMNLKFEFVKLDGFSGNRKRGKRVNRLAGWLEKHGEEREFVVVKAEAAFIEEIMRGGDYYKVIKLIDELFLTCDPKSAYWECLALYGKLKDEGVFVHQWWD